MKIGLALFCSLLCLSEASAQLSFCTGRQGPPIYNEDFGQGTANGPALNADITSYTYVATNPFDGQYTISSQIGQRDSWHMTGDHTGNTNGRAFIVNADLTPGIFYQTPIDGLCENSSYEFSAWFLNVYNPDSRICTSGSLPINIKFEIWSGDNKTLLKSGDTGNVGDSANPIWKNAGLTFTTGAGQGRVILKMINNGQGGCGNDLAIDDIQFRSCGDDTSINDPAGMEATSFCEGDTSNAINLNAQVNTKVYATPEYQWQVSTNGTTFNDIVGEDQDTYTVPSLTTIRFYRVKIAESSANLANALCNTFSTTYRIGPIAVAPPTTQSASAVICDGNPVLLEATAQMGEGVDWYDQASGGNLLQRGNARFTASIPGTYFAESRNVELGCTSPGRTTFTVTSGNSPIVIDKELIQCGTTPVLLVPDVDVVDYLWSTGATTRTIEVQEEGDYSVILTNAEGCSATQTFRVSRTDEPIIDALEQKGNYVVVRATANVPLRYSLNGIDFVDENRLPLPEEPTGTVYVKDINDCFIVSQDFDFIIIPLFFTPNNDGINDLWTFRGLRKFNTVRLSIFDRFGRLLDQKNGNAIEWDGTYKGRPLPSDAYWYRLEADDRQIVGSVALKR